jgi:hypothetical protein
MADSGAESEVDRVGLVLEEEGREVQELRAGVVPAVGAEAVEGAVDAAAEVEAEIKMADEVLTTDSSRALATGGVNSLRTPVPFLSRCKTRP